MTRRRIQVSVETIQIANDTNLNASRAAKSVGLSIQTFTRRCQEFGIATKKNQAGKGLSAIERYGTACAAQASEKISAANTGRTFTLSEEAKRKMSLKRIQTLETSPHVKWFEVAGIKVQGSWEKLVGERLVESGYEIRRERLAYDGHRHYTPDFYIPSLDLYVEVKGWLSDRDKAKYRKVMTEHSDKKIKILTGKKTVLNFKCQDLFDLPDLKNVI